MAMLRGFARAVQISSVARADGTHALIRGQRPVDFDHNIFLFINGLKFGVAPHNSFNVELSVVPQLLAVGSRTVRVTATYADASGRRVEEATCAGSACCLATSSCRQGMLWRGRS
jgi:hypothetical protein